MTDDAGKIFSEGYTNRGRKNRERQVYEHGFAAGRLVEINFGERMKGLLFRFGLERTGWRQWIFGRWFYNHEPLRNDAANLIREMGYQQLQPFDTKLVGAEKETAP